jgi:hypothetical protein
MLQARSRADYDAQSTVERELVLRLANLPWRLPRATTMETGLFEIQAEQLEEFKRVRQAMPASREVVYALFGRAHSVSYDRDPASDGVTNATTVLSSGSKSYSTPPAGNCSRNDFSAGQKNKLHSREFSNSKQSTPRFMRGSVLLRCFDI